MVLDCIMLVRPILPGEGTRLVGALLVDKEGPFAEVPVVWQPESNANRAKLSEISNIRFILSSLIKIKLYKFLEKLSILIILTFRWQDG